MIDAKTFLKQLRATLKQHGFQRLNANNYFHRAEFLLCLFTIQKSMYGGQYYFDVYYRLADDDPKEKNYRALWFGRLASLFATEHETIRSIDFDDPALVRQFAPQFLARLPAIADDLAAWTDTTAFLQRFGDDFSAEQQAAIAAHTFRPE